MSIIAQQTPFTFVNKSNHYLEISVVAEQDDSFRVDTAYGNNVIPVTTSDLVQSDNMFSSFVNNFMRMMHGEKLHAIKINLPAGVTIEASVRCTSTLYFTTNILSKDATEVISGDFEIGPESHGDPMRVVWAQQLGFAYTDTGDVSIGANIATSQDVSIVSEFYNKKGKRVTGPDVTPACCRVQIQ